MVSALGVLRWLAGHALRVEEVWFDEPCKRSADIVRHFQSPGRVEGARNYERQTLILDLRKADEDLLGAMDKGTRYDIRRAERDGCQVEFVQPTPRTMRELNRAFATLRSRKHAGSLNQSRLIALHNQGMAAITVCRSAEGSALSWHVYILAGQRARLLYSVSPLSRATPPSVRQAIGRANRLHHWRDMQLLRNLGRHVYDFGGWYAGSSDQEKLAVNAFKESFGGAHEQAFDATLARTPLGRIALVAQRFIAAGP